MVIFNSYVKLPEGNMGIHGCFPTTSISGGFSFPKCLCATLLDGGHSSKKSTIEHGISF
jgi:hypothetical protein